jgi:hypothetical protein
VRKKVIKVYFCKKINYIKKGRVLRERKMEGLAPPKVKRKT